MSFPNNLYLAAFFGALATAFIALPVWRAWCVRTGLVDDPGHRKIHDSPIPLAGGLAVLTGLMVPLATGLLLLKFPSTVARATVGDQKAVTGYCASTAAARAPCRRRISSEYCAAVTGFPT